VIVFKRRIGEMEVDSEKAVCPKAGKPERVSRV
jgi:hypothetical protein